MQQEKIRTIHVYFEETPIDEDETIILDGDDGQPQPTRYVALGVFCGIILSLLCIVIPTASLLLPQFYPNTYDTSITKTVILTLSRHPEAGQLSLSAPPAISIKKQATIAATGSIHQDASKATGLITFYNGAFTTQTVPAGTSLTGKDGVTVVTEQTAVIPPATATTPPTYGTVSVTARSSTAGARGNIPASDINQACCGTSILAQNLYAFSGGHDARDITLLTKDDISTGRQALAAQVNDAVNAQAQQEVKPGFILLPLDCTTTFSASHQAGDQAAASLLALTKTCTPLVYSAVDIEKLAQRSIAIPQFYHLVSFTALVVQSNVTAQGGTLTVHAIAYLKHNVVPVHTYRFPGK
ncbi:MAG TPA: baseplate J/gp47 family protein [Ktedonobacteraceae bacterium]